MGETLIGGYPETKQSMILEAFNHHKAKQGEDFFKLFHLYGNIDDTCEEWATEIYVKGKRLRTYNGLKEQIKGCLDSILSEKILSEFDYLERSIEMEVPLEEMITLARCLLYNCIKE